VRRDRLEHAPDFRRGDVFELYNLQAGADLPFGIGGTVDLDTSANHGLIGGDDPIQAFRIDKGRVVGSQRGLKQIDNGRFRNRLGGLDRDLALDAGIDSIFDGENIAEDGLGRLRRRYIDEVKRDTIGDVFR